MSRYGFVYVLHNPAMPGIYKVGVTERSPSCRADELSRATGVPHAFEVSFYAEFRDPSAHERRVHEALRDYRFSSDREFFRAPLAVILAAIEDDGEHLSSWDSDMAVEARNPGKVWSGNPLWFERPLHDAGYLERVRRASL